MNEQNNRIGLVLLEKNFNPAILQAYSVLSPLLNGETSCERFRKLLEDPLISATISNYRIFPRIIEATIAKFPQQAHGLLVEFERIQFGGFTNPDPQRKLKFPFPTVLGFLNGLKYIDRDLAWTCKEYVPELGILFMYVIFGESEFRVDHGSDLDIQKGLLSEAVTFLVKGRGGAGEVGARRAHLLNFLNVVRAELETGKILSKFGEVLIDEICHKLYGTLSTHGRVKSLALLHTDLLTSLPG